MGAQGSKGRLLSPDGTVLAKFFGAGIEYSKKNSDFSVIINLSVFAATPPNFPSKSHRPHIWYMWEEGADVVTGRMWAQTMLMLFIPSFRE